MRVLGIFFFILICIVSCKEEKQSTEELTCQLSEKEMIDVMVDVALVKSAKAILRKGLRDSGIRPYDYLFVKHGVDTIIIKENLRQYNKDLSKSKKLYDTVAKILQARSDYLQVILDTIQAQKGIKDSLDIDIDSEELSIPKDVDSTFANQ